MKQKNVTILGEGAWGTALATLCAHNGYAVTLWCYHGQVVEQIERNRINEKFLPGVILDSAIKPTNDVHTAVRHADIIIQAIPVAFFESVLSSIIVPKSVVWILTSKGIQEQTSFLPTDILYAMQNTHSYVVLAGPTFAHELVAKKQTFFFAAGLDKSIISLIEKLFSSEYSSVTWSSDIVGTQLCAALKNVVAIALGMLHGIGLGENIRAAAATALLQEMTVLVQAAGGVVETVYSLAGIGDLVLTCLSMHSRNTQLGRKLGEGYTLDQALAELSGVSEGAATVRSIPLLEKKYGITLPLFLVVHDIVILGDSIEKFVTMLMKK